MSDVNYFFRSTTTFSLSTTITPEAARGADIAAGEQREIGKAIQLDLPVVMGEPIPILYVQMDGTGEERNGGTQGQDQWSTGAYARNQVAMPMGMPRSACTMYDVYNDLNFSGFWKFTATLSNGTITGTFDNGGGTFTLHRD